MEKKIEVLDDDVEYLIIQNDKTKEIIAKITQYDSGVFDGYIVKIKS